MEQDGAKAQRVRTCEAASGAAGEAAMRIRLDLSNADLDVNEDDPEVAAIIAEVNEEACHERWLEGVLAAYRPTPTRPGAWLSVVEGGGDSSPPTGQLRGV